MYQEVGGQGAAPLERLPALRALKQGGGLDQRWASTLANRSNALHRSNIRAPPRPLPPDVCTQSVGICVARGAGSDS